MFVESVIEDELKIFPDNTNKLETVKNILIKNYINKYIDILGIGIQIKGEVVIQEQKCVEDYIIAKVLFNLIYFKFFKDEILKVKILTQNQHGIYVSIEFYDRIFISKDDLPCGSEITYIFSDANKKQKKLSWVWVYKNSRFIFQDGESAKVKVIGYDSTFKVIKASFSETGLGPTAWWQ